MGRLMGWRKEVIASVFNQQADEVLQMENRNYYARHIADGSHVAVEAKVDGKPAGCGGLCLQNELPSPDNPNGRCGYLMNIYVRPQYREHGVGSAVVEYLVQTARNLKCDKIYLESTIHAMPLYQNLGFQDMDGMMRCVNQLNY